MKMNKKVLLIVLAVIIIAAGGIWFYIYRQNETYYATDNAKVMSELKTVTATAGGELIKWDALPNTFVKENQVLGRTNTGVDIKSPITGVVAKSNVVLNQTIAPASPLAVIANTEDIYISANIEETVAAKISLGQEVQLKLDAYPGKKLIGHVREIDTVTVAALSGNATSFSTSGTYTKVTQLIPIKITIDDEVALEKLIGTNAFVKINLKKINEQSLAAGQNAAASQSGQIDASGKVKSAKAADVVPEFSATITEVVAKEGQILNKGDVIMTLDLKEINKMISDQEKNLRIENLQLKKLLNSTTNTSFTEGNAIQTAQENLTKAQEDYDKQQQLYSAGAVSSDALAESKRKLTAAQRAFSEVKLSKTTDLSLSVDMEREKISLLQDQLNMLKGKINKPYLQGNAFVCPTDNTVIQGLTAVSGSMVVPNMKLFSLTDLSQLVIEADIQENQIKNVQIGSNVDIVPVADSDKVFKGTVKSIAGAGLLKNGETVITAEIAIEQPDTSLKPNYNVDVTIYPEN